jgi:hypothetical protein
MVGQDVAELHQTLTALGMEIDKAELDAQRFGPTTTDALRRLQTQLKLTPTGEVDEKMWAQLDAARTRLGLPSTGKGGGTASNGKTPIVQGNVTDTDGMPLVGVTVVALHKDVRDSQEIGRAVTDAKGHYLIPAVPSDVESKIITKNGDGSSVLDLQFHVLDKDSKNIFTSEVYFKVKQGAQINLALGGNTRATAPEFTRIGQAIEPLLKGKLQPEALLETKDSRDLTLLSGKTGLSRTWLAYYTVGARLAKQTGLPPQLFYALFRQNIPADAGVKVLASTTDGADLDKNADRLLKSLLASSDAVRAKAIESAIAHNIIPASYTKQAPDDLKKLTTLATANALSTTFGMGKTSIGTVLSAAAVPDETQQKFIALYKTTQRPSRAFWQGLVNNQGFSPTDVATLRFAVNTGNFTNGHLPLVNALIEMRQQGKIKGTRDLARYDAAKWKELITKSTNGTAIGIPANFTGKSAGDAVDGYAHMLERNFEQAHPTTAFSARLAADAKSPFAENAKSVLTAFLDANPSFSLLRTNIDRFLKDTPPPAGTDAATFRTALAQSQRLIKLTSRYAAAKPLLADNLHSSQQIYAMGRDRFLNAYKNHPDIGITEAEKIYAKAEQTYALSLSLMLNHHAAMSAGNPAAIASQDAPAVQAALDGFPNLQTLFGSSDFCDCESCETVLSPAAYLVDLLHFLSQRMTKGKSAKQVLLERRPDLALIELSCQNTNTVLPYIDLVNELLEDVVAPPADLIAAARGRQTGLTTDELNANPQFVNNNAYDALAKAIFPWILPFDLPLNEARTYLGQLGLDRVQLMRTFLTPPPIPYPADIAKMTPTDIAKEPAVIMAIEGLGLSPLEADIIIGGPLAVDDKGKAWASWDYWGLTEKGNKIQDPVDLTITVTDTWLEVLAHVRILLDRSGLSYVVLTQLLKTVFVNPDGTVQLQNNPPDSCDLSSMTIVGLNADILDRLHRFVRLMRKLNWDVFSLDAAINLLQPGNKGDLKRLNSTLLRQLYAVKSVMKQYNLPLTTALALFGNIETRDILDFPNRGDNRYALYHSLFQNLTVLSPVDPAFILNNTYTQIQAASTNPSPMLTDHCTTLLSAFGISDDDLSLAISNFTDGKLTLANVSTLYKHIILAQSLNISIKELSSLKGLIERKTLEKSAQKSYEIVNPFDATRPELFGVFCSAVEEIRASGFSITTLDYLLRHVYDSTSGLAPDDVVVGTLLKSIRDSLTQIAANNTSNAAPASTVVQQIASALGLPNAITEALLTSWFISPTDATKYFVDDFLALPDIRRDQSQVANPISRTENGFATYFTEYAALDKAARVIIGFGLTADETSWLAKAGITLGWLDLTKLPLAQQADPGGTFVRWHRLADAAIIKKGLPSDGKPFTALMDYALNPDPNDQHPKNTYMLALQARTQWPLPGLQILCGDPADTNSLGLLSLKFPEDYKAERALSRLFPAFSLLRQLGSSSDIRGWIGSQVTADQAASIKQTVKAKYSNSQWLSIAKPLRDVLREQQRDALVAYLLAHRPDGVTRWHDPNDVYSLYLIDVEMNACLGTSRIVQANATIQLFVQRCFLNLEPEVTVDASQDSDWLQWQWMSQYRVWEANREVFLFPENWIEPALRHDKSPFFQTLESDLLQNEVTSDTAEDAFRGYLEKLEAVARLEVVGTYNQVELDHSTFHVVARKQGHPPTHYYRQWIDESRWTAWTKIDLDIVSDHVLPIVWNRCLYLFWAIITQQPDRQQKQVSMTPSSDYPPDVNSHLEVQLAWSEYKGQKWLAKQTAPQIIAIPQKTPNPNGFIEPFRITLKSALDGALLRIDLFVDDGSEQQNCHTVSVSIYDNGDLIGKQDQVTCTDLGATKPWHLAEFVLGGVGNAVEAYWGNIGRLAVSDLSSIGPDTRWIGILSPMKPDLELPSQSAFDAMSIVPAPATWNTSTTRQRITTCYTTYYYNDNLQSELIMSQAGRYRLVIPHQILRFDSSLPFFYEDALHSFFVIPAIYYRNGNYFTTSYTYNAFYKAEYTFKSFYHAFVPLFLRELDRWGIDGLFARDVQVNPAAVQGINAFDFNSYYQPDPNLITTPFPVEGVDFDPDTGYAIYNWELFFHAPLEIAESLSRNQRFAEAKHWYEYVFNPTSTTKDHPPQRYWVTKPFYEMTAANYQMQQIQNLLKLINTHDANAEKQVAEWRQYPFDPHVIAQLRPVAYQRVTVMKYIDNLIAWGDQLFHQDTIESINAATQLYVLAQQLLGPRPEKVTPQERPVVKTYADLEASLDEFANAVSAAENVLSPVNVNMTTDPTLPKLPLVPLLYFRIPPNDQLFKYWDTVEDRLFKIRHCMNIEGVVQQLALFAPPIDPGMLVKAAAAGLDLSSILSDTNSAVPPYRFRIIVREAIEICEMIRGLGNSLLGVLEKRDSSTLEILRSSSEKKLQDQIRAIKQRAIDEADQAIDGLAKQRLAILERQSFYGARLDPLQFMNAWEAGALVSQTAGTIFDVMAVVLETAAGAAALLPTAQFGASGAGGSPHVTAQIGGPNIAHAVTSAANAARIGSIISHAVAQMTQTLGSYARRREDWELQYKIANRELDHIDSQTVAAQIRKDIVTKERDNHEITAILAADVDDFLHSKFTNQDLYEWMISQTSATYFQAYQLAYAVAKRAEQCFRRELGVVDSSYVQFGYWDSLKKGLLAGDNLLYDLQRMQADYYVQNARKPELTKHISLLTLDPYALVELRATGTCNITLPEILFDLENPGHIAREIKSVGVTAACVVGPYTNVPMTLTLNSSYIRRDTTTAQYNDIAHDPGLVPGPGDMSAIVTSSGQNDRGLFELKFDDDRYLPFEGAGVISTWTLRLNPVFPQFDYKTISDIVLHVQYTARDVGEPFTTTVKGNVTNNLNAIALAENRNGLYYLISARHDYSANWYKFLNPGDGQEQVLTIDTAPDRFPFFTRGLDIKVKEIDLMIKSSNTNSYTLQINNPDGSAIVDPVTKLPSLTLLPNALGNLYHLNSAITPPIIDLKRAPADKPYPTWSLKLQQSGAAGFRPVTATELDDIFIILHYQVSQ